MEEEEEEEEEEEDNDDHDDDDDDNNKYNVDDNDAGLVEVKADLELHMKNNYKVPWKNICNLKCPPILFSLFIH